MNVIDIVRYILGYSMLLLLVIASYCILIYGIKFLDLKYKEEKRKRNL